MSYSEHFMGIDSARDYDAREYAKGSASACIWRIEQGILKSILSRLPVAVPVHLDFACGTARVLSFLENYTRRSVGLDISPSMLALAKEKTKRAELVCGDIVNATPPLAESYDLITAFRFFSNAEDELRRSALARLGARMHADSRLVLNSHTNPWSLKAFLWPYHTLRRILGKRIHMRYLSRGALNILISDAGLEAVEWHSYGSLPQRMSALMGAKTTQRADACFNRYYLLRRFGTHQLAVCRRR